MIRVLGFRVQSSSSALVPLQVLLTGNDLRQHSSQKWLLHTMNSLLQMKVVPVLNGNDALAPDPSDSSDLENARKASACIRFHDVERQ